MQGSQQGRWLSPDPAGTGWNQYSYATNPLISVDPSGLACYPLEKQIFGTCAGFGLLGDDNGGYTLDGVDAPVWLVMSLLNGGTAIQCPNNNCSFVRTGPNGQFQQYVPYPTTQSGLTIYTGNGSWINVSQLSNSSFWTLTADTLGVVSAVSRRWQFGAVSSLISLASDHSLTNVMLNVGANLIPLVVEGSDLPIAYGFAVYDGSQFVANQVIIPVFTPDGLQSDTIDANGYSIPGPQATFDSGQYAGPN